METFTSHPWRYRRFAEASILVNWPTSRQLRLHINGIEKQRCLQGYPSSFPHAYQPDANSGSAVPLRAKVTAYGMLWKDNALI